MNWNKYKKSLLKTYRRLRCAVLAARRSLPYIDITAQTIDPERGVLRDEFLVREMVDHHQSQAMTAPLWVDELKPVLAAIDRRQHVLA